MNSILTCTTIQDFYAQIQQVESKRAGLNGRIVTILGTEYSLNEIIDCYFKLIQTADRDDSNCLAPKVFKLLSHHQNEGQLPFYGLFSQGLANFLVTDYLGTMQQKMAIEIQKKMANRNSRSTLTRTDIENICDHFSSINFDCSTLMDIMYKVFRNREFDLDNKRKVSLLYQACNYLLENRDKISYRFRDLEILHETYTTFLWFLPEEVQMAALLKILKDQPEFITAFLRNLKVASLTNNINATKLSDNQLSQLAMLVAVNFPEKIIENSFICDIVRKTSGSMPGELCDDLDKINLFLCAKQSDAGSSLNPQNGLPREIADLIIKASAEELLSSFWLGPVKRKVPSHFGRFTLF